LFQKLVVSIKRRSHSRLSVAVNVKIETVELESAKKRPETATREGVAHG
jgi:hypothetical protein